MIVTRPELLECGRRCRLPTGRRQLNARVSWAAVDWIDQLAAAEGVTTADGRPNRSEMVRLLLAYAARHWQKGWRP